MRTTINNGKRRRPDWRADRRRGADGSADAPETQHAPALSSKDSTCRFVSIRIVAVLGAAIRSRPFYQFARSPPMDSPFGFTSLDLASFGFAQDRPGKQDSGGRLLMGERAHDIICSEAKLVW